MAIQLQKPDYIVVYVSDMSRSAAFYRDVYFSLPPQLQPTGRTLAVLHDPDGFGITLQQR